MRIAIIAVGSRGDVEPYVALGAGLKSRGHTVRLIAPFNFSELIQAQGLELWALDVDVQEIAQSTAMSKQINQGNFLSMMKQMAKEAEAQGLHLAKAGLAACAGMDLMVSGIGGLYPALALAEKLSLPFLQAYYIPFTPTRFYPSFLLPSLPFSPSKSFNRLSYHLARQAMWQGFRPADNLVRQKELHLPKAPFWGPKMDIVAPGSPVLYAYSPSVIPKPPDWGENIHVTGYWFLKEPQDWSPPQPLVDFVASGTPPVYVGFGSMPIPNPAETMDTLVKALLLSGQRGIIQTGWGGLHAADLPASIMLIDSAPFSWLFPRTQAVVHHGGAGTTAAGLRAGVPSIIVPFFADQPYWGRRVAELGVGPTPIPFGKLSPTGLANAIQLVASDTSMRQRAVDLGAKIQAEDGVSTAVDHIERIYTGRS